MPGVVTALAVIALISLAFILLEDSDDDNSNGGLMEPSLIPVTSNKSKQQIKAK